MQSKWLHIINVNPDYLHKKCDTKNNFIFNKHSPTDILYKMIKNEFHSLLL